jgi:ribokinase
MPPILNIGSLNIDRVFSVEHITSPGETISSTSLAVFAGGKGANQSVALARAGVQVAHAGKVGADGQWLIERLGQEGVDTRHIKVSEFPTGQAMIHVDKVGQNASVLLAGANRQLGPLEIDEALDDSGPDSWLLVQNETSGVGHAISSAKRRGMRVALNPAPLDAEVLRYPLDQLDLICVNESEAAALVSRGSSQEVMAALLARWPRCEIVLTLGAGGVLHGASGKQLHVPARKVEAVDTTAAGDTFNGAFAVALAEGATLEDAALFANAAGAISVTRPGAQNSVPTRAEVETLLATRRSNACLR